MTETRRILVVEDDESVRRLVSLALEASGFDVIEAENGTEGLRLLKARRPDAVVLDLLMPDLGGERMLQALRAAPETKRTPVVVTSGKPDVPAEVIGLVGKENFLSKPFDADVLVDRVKALLA